MEIIKTEIEGPLIIKPNVFGDSRGQFFEAFRKDIFFKAGIEESFVQDNISVSSKNAVRGLHFQKAPFAQGKLVMVLKGCVKDVIIDIRKDSPTYGKKLNVEISDKNRLIFYVPVGFAHGFSVLEDDTIFMYKCTNIYDKESEGGIIYNDPDLNINWSVDQTLVSEKDLLLSTFRDLESPF